MTPEEILYVHVTGTDQTTSLSREAVRSGIAEGRIRHSQLIWSPADNAWKPARELPGLLPSQPSPDAPRPVAPSVAAPKPRVTVTAPKVAVKAVAPRAAVATTPRVAVSAAARAGARTGRSVVVETDDDSHLLRWLCIIPGLLILALVALNYFLVDQPLVGAMRQTAFPGVTIYAHLGAFVQPGALVIHVPANSAITHASLPDFLVALAHSTPATPLGGTFDRVGLTTGMTSEYTFSGTAWKQLGDMDGESAERRKGYILEEADNSGGVSIVPAPVKVGGKYIDQRENAWNRFVGYFASF
jgi:hypothetical protein